MFAQKTRERPAAGAGTGRHRTPTSNTVPTGNTAPRAAALIALYVALVLAPLAVVTVFGGMSDEAFGSQLGMGLGLVGLPMLALQFVLSARLRRLERPFGQDMVYGFHSAMGVLAALLLLAHPVVLAAADDKWPLLWSARAPWYIWVGRASLLLLAAHVLLAVFRVGRRLKHETWRAIHTALAVLVLGGGLVHSWRAGDDLKNLPTRAVWLALVTTAALAYLWHRGAPVADAPPGVPSPRRPAGGGGRLDPHHGPPGRRGDVGAPSRPVPLSHLTLRRNARRGAPFHDRVQSHAAGPDRLHHQSLGRLHGEDRPRQAR